MSHVRRARRQRARQEPDLRTRAPDESRSGGASMIVTLVVDTFNINNNGTTMSAMRFAAALIARGHTVRVVACGEPGNTTGQGSAGSIDAPASTRTAGPEMFYVPELRVPIASWFAHRQSTLFAKPV